MIAQYCAAMKPKEWIPPSPSNGNCEPYSYGGPQKDTQPSAQKNRLASCRDDSVRESLKRVIEQLEAEIVQVGQQIQQHIDSHPELAEQQQLLISIKGFKQ